MAHAFTHPSILDVKLGTVLYAPEASEEKKARMQKNAEGTTIALSGMRLTGSQVGHCSSYLPYLLPPTLVPS
jgi:1D-myo-inositol-tetrakisphosphate 5-kinase/inositol-polyphosphate multikinase